MEEQSEERLQREPERAAPLHEKLFNTLEVRVAIKIGLAASISLYTGVGFAALYDRPDYLLSGSWCVLSTFAVLQAHLGGTYRAAWVRILGVLIGSIMGGVFTGLFGSNGISLGVSIAFTVLILSLLQLKDSVRIACMSLSIVMILWGLHPSMSPWKFSLYRFVDSALGILIAVFVAHVIWPSQATERLRANIARTIRAIHRLFKLELSPKQDSKQLDRIRKKLTREILQLLSEAQQFLKECELELLTKSRSLEKWSVLIEHLESIFRSTTKLRTFQEYNLSKILDSQLYSRMSEITQASMITMTDLGERLRRKESEKGSADLLLSLQNLEEELNRFRLTRTTRKFERKDVEHFFVFFYNLRSITEELLKLENKISELNKEPI